MSDLTEQKASARKSAFVRRKAAYDGRGDDAENHLAEALKQHRGLPMSGYLPIRTEIDPLPAMAEAATYGTVGVPVIVGPGLP